jgi:HD-GYP domain-containing protein (c-di-GMP phosphodiesterase class II)
MRRIARERLPFTLFLLSLSAVGPAALLHVFGPEPSGIPGSTHLLLVVVCTGVAAATAIGMTAVGARRGDARSVVLGTAFMAMTALLLVHGLATPGVLVPPNGVVAFAGAASLPVGAALLALSAAPSLRGPRRVRQALALQAGLVLLIATLGVTSMVEPKLVPIVPAPASPPAIALLVGGMTFFALVAFRAAGTFALTRRRADLLVVVGTVWLGFALVPQLTLSPTTLALYIGHAFELLGVALVGIPVALDLRRGVASRPLVGDLRAVELVAEEEAFLGARIRRLMHDLAAKDASTELHTRRVALCAVRIGEELGLSPARLRELALGGLLHDIGKLAVPTEILRKPAKLTDEEFAAIRRHPQAGADLLDALGGFSDDVRRLVLDHHERLDGRGYPRGLTAGDLDLETRIMAVSDVYDALVSDRVYRAAWTPERALDLLRDGVGTEFDADCVAALERTLGVETAPAPAVAAAA